MYKIKLLDTNDGFFCQYLATLTADYGGLAVKKQSSKATIEATLVKELDIKSHLSSRQNESLSRSDTRRTVEDLLEVKRYKAMHEDYFDL